MLHAPPRAHVTAALLASAACLCSPSVRATDTEWALLTARVTDTTGAVLPGVTVTAKAKGHPDVVAVTNANGSATLVLHDNIEHVLSVELMGFRTLELHGVTLDHETHYTVSDLRLAVAYDPSGPDVQEWNPPGWRIGSKYPKQHAAMLQFYRAKAAEQPGDGFIAEMIRVHGNRAKTLGEPYLVSVAEQHLPDLSGNTILLIEVEPDDDVEPSQVAVTGRKESRTLAVDSSGRVLVVLDPVAWKGASITVTFGSQRTIRIKNVKLEPERLYAVSAAEWIFDSDEQRRLDQDWKTMLADYDISVRRFDGKSDADED